MAAFDANLMLLNNAAITSAGGVAVMTGAFVDLGTGGTPVGGVSVRMDLNTADAAGSTILVEVQASDNSSALQESWVLSTTVTGTDARAAGGVKRFLRVATKRRYIRYRATLSGAAASFSGTIGVDGGDWAAVR